MAAQVPLFGVPCGAPTVPTRMASTGGVCFCDFCCLTCLACRVCFCGFACFVDFGKMEILFVGYASRSDRNSHDCTERGMENQLPAKPASTQDRRWSALGMAFGAFILVFFVWQFTNLNPILYPLRLLVTFVHETGHGLT